MVSAASLIPTALLLLSHQTASKRPRWVYSTIGMLRLAGSSSTVTMPSQPESTSTPSSPLAWSPLQCLPTELKREDLKYVVPHDLRFEFVLSLQYSTEVPRQPVHYGIDRNFTRLSSSSRQRKQIKRGWLKAGLDPSLFYASMDLFMKARGTYIVQQYLDQYYQL